jgi:hypothetical protein
MVVRAFKFAKFQFGPKKARMYLGFDFCKSSIAVKVIDLFGLYQNNLERFIVKMFRIL